MRRKNLIIIIVGVAIVVGLTIIMITIFKTAKEEYDHVIPSVDFDIYSSNGLRITPEKDYDNFVVSADDSHFSSDVEQIKFHLKNNNPGRGFYFYNAPIVDKMIKGEWKAVAYDPSSKRISRYGFCGNENDAATCFSAVIRLYLEFLQVSELSGQYRVGLITPKKIFYYYFCID